MCDIVLFIISMSKLAKSLVPKSMLSPEGIRAITKLTFKPKPQITNLHSYKTFLSVFGHHC